jgi:two-component system, OmpR family, response regulator
MAEKQYRILLVDDDIDYLFQTRMKLENAGYEVITAESQKQAENILKQIRPDLAIFDLMMENDDSGFVLAYRCKANYPDLPVIIATNVAAETGVSFRLQEQTDWIKADKYLEKGIQTEQLLLHIQQLIETCYGKF